MTEQQLKAMRQTLERYVAQDVYLPLLPKQREAAERAQKEMGEWEF